MAGGPASHACRRGSGSTRGFNFFVLGDSFTRSPEAARRLLRGRSGIQALKPSSRLPQNLNLQHALHSRVITGYVPPQERTARGGFGLGDSFTRSGVMARGFWFFWGTLLPFVLRVVAGACVGRWTGQPRMPPQERLHEGVSFFVWRFYVPPQERTARGGLVSGLRAASGEDGTRGLVPGYVPPQEKTARGG